MSRARVETTRAALAVAATIASFLATDALCRAANARDGPAILSAVLAMSIARRADAAEDRRRLALTPFVLAVAAVGASAVGWLFATRPAFGAIAFVAGIAFSIYVRNFDGPWPRVGRAIALPLVAILVVPARADAPGGPAVDLALVVAAGVVALASVVAVLAIARPFVPVPVARSVARPAPARERTAGTGLGPTTRLALQMAVSLTCAFAVGFASFPEHWSWTVFTAFVVASGARARGDVAVKGVQRLAGALAGTVVATVLLRVWRPEGALEAIAIFAILFVGLALRERNYAYWAATMTIILSLLSGAGTPLDASALVRRLAAILIGALVAVAAAWFVVPIRTTDVVRKRLSDALVAFDELFVDADGSEARRDARAAFDARLVDLERAGSPLTFHHRFARGEPLDHPARWVASARRLRARVDALPERALDARTVASVRRAIGDSRRAIGRYRTADIAPDAPSVEQTLHRLHDCLDDLAARVTSAS